MKRPTLKDVARRAGVSLSTASDALSGRGRMTEATRSRVAEVADTLGYAANAVAAGLRTGRIHTIGLHHEDAHSRLDTPYLRNFLAGVLDVAQQYDYDVTVLSSNASRPRRTFPHVDGVIVIDPIADDLRAEELMSAPVPVVVGERLPRGMPEASVVAVKHETAFTQLLQEADELQVRRPVLFAPDENSGWGDLLTQHFEQWCRVRSRPGTVVRSPFAESTNVARFRRIFAELLAADSEIDYLVAAGSHAVRGGIEAAREAGRRPGEDLNFASASGSLMLREEDPPVSRVELPSRRLGEACARRLIEILDNGAPPSPEVLVPVSAELHLV